MKKIVNKFSKISNFKENGIFFFQNWIWIAECHIIIMLAVPQNYAQNASYCQQKRRNFLPRLRFYKKARAAQWDEKVPDTEGGANRRFLGH